MGGYYRKPVKTITGEEILKGINKMNKFYLQYGNDNEIQPTLIITTKQCYKLLDCTGVICRYYNSLKALADGLISSFNYGSVVLSIKGV